MKRKLGLLALSLCLLFTAGCIKPYDKPEYVEINNNETAFMVPLEGATADTVKFDSAAALEKCKVASKRIQIPKRWNKTGRLPAAGHWMPLVKVITVNRSPITREWDVNTGPKNKTDQAIWAESTDSIGFSTGFNCTAYISEPDSAKFLYWYPNSGLAEVMDGEIRTRIQQIVSEVASRYTMDKLRVEKQQIIEAVRKDIIPFYAERGITITTVGQFGGFAYENAKIQEAIDAVFVAQQEKAVEASLLEAMTSKKTRMLDEGMASANQKREEARGAADGILLIKEAEAKGIILINDALEKAKTNPVFVAIKSLEVEEKRIEKWGGQVPAWITDGGGGGFVPMMNPPAQTLPMVNHIPPDGAEIKASSKSQ